MGEKQSSTQGTASIGRREGGKMPDSQWIPRVRNAGVLRFKRGRTVSAGTWSTVIAASLQEINGLLRNSRINLAFEEAAESTQLEIEVTRGPIPGPAGGGALASDRHGATRLVKGGAAGAADSELHIQRGWIYLPVTPGGSRNPPRGLMQVMMVHEFLHAAGLSAHSRAMDDVMAAQMEDGLNGKVHPWGGLGQDMPPCIIIGDTVTRLVNLWGQTQ
jgi:hypothetical protein